MERLIPLVYGELRRIAGALMARESAGHTLQPTALAHEVFLRLVDQREATWRDRVHFYSLAARLMRRLLIDHAREIGAARRGGEQIRVPLTESTAGAEEPDSVDLLDLDRALDDLAREDEMGARIVELRFYGGLSIEEAAEVLDCSRPTVVRHWKSARGWLFERLVEGKDG
jgi:RNA polymerase sigma factor (TIGR02999 family)